LREHPVKLAKFPDTTSAPGFVVTSPGMNLELVNAYRGQDFTWRQTPTWDSTAISAWVRWLTLRDIPQSGESLILWVRDDLFLDK